MRLAHALASALLLALAAAVSASAQARAKVSKFYYGSHVDKPTPEEIEAAHHHDAELESATAEESVEHADRRELTGSAD